MKTATLLLLALHILVSGVAAAGLGALVRTLPWPERLKKRKPWSCSACLAGHAAWIVMLASWTWPGWYQAGLIYFGSLAVAAFILHQLFPPEIDLGL